MPETVNAWLRINGQEHVARAFLQLGYGDERHRRQMINPLVQSFQTLVTIITAQGEK